MAAAEYMNCTGITTSVLGRKLMTTCRRSKQSVVLIPMNCTTILLHSLSIYIQRGSCTCIYLVKCKTEASSFNNNITGDICSKCPLIGPLHQEIGPRGSSTASHVHRCSCCALSWLFLISSCRRLCNSRRRHRHTLRPALLDPRVGLFLHCCWSNNNRVLRGCRGDATSSIMINSLNSLQRRFIPKNCKR
jgi:hypothetical protein